MKSTSDKKRPRDNDDEDDEEEPEQKQSKIDDDKRNGGDEELDLPLIENKEETNDAKDIEIQFPSKYLTHQRFQTKSQADAYNTRLDLSDVRTYHQRDYDKVIFSSAFSRLRDKTQIFPLVQNDNVHTRLSHSLEVHSVGKTLARMVTAKMKPTKNQDKAKNDRIIEDVVATACLLHDIGNPPFGHSGEAALCSWFKDWVPPKEYGLSGNWEVLKKNFVFKDFEYFEGNATGFRVIRKKIPKITFATIAAYMKYPRISAFHKKKNLLAWKKNGVYLADVHHYHRIAQSCSLGILEKENELSWERHPLTYLVEAADDICYGVIDIEDAYRMKVISEKEAEDVLNGLGPPNKNEQTNDDPEEQFDGPFPVNNIQSLRVQAFDYWVEQAQKTFIEKFHDICAGSYSSPLVNSDAKAWSDAKDLLRKNVYSCREVLEVEAAGFLLIKDLMNRFVNAALMHNGDYSESNSVDRESEKIFQLLPIEVRAEIVACFKRQFVEGFKYDTNQEIDPNIAINKMKDGELIRMLRAELTQNEFVDQCPVEFCLVKQTLLNDQGADKHLKQKLFIIYYIILIISDYIAGMTDTFATSLYQKLRGVSLLHST